MTLGIEPRFPVISAGDSQLDEASAVCSYMSEPGRGSSQGTIALPGALSQGTQGVAAGRRHGTSTRIRCRSTYDVTQ
jgi:hypothetical protein